MPEKKLGAITDRTQLKKRDKLYYFPTTKWKVSFPLSVFTCSR